MKKIALIGTGKLGTKLAENIIFNSLCDEIYLFNRSKEKLEGTILSLNIWASLIESKTSIKYYDIENINDIDLIIIALKEQYDPRELIQIEKNPGYIPHNLRYIGVMKDLPLILETCNPIKDYRGIIGVVTNPVDIMSTFVSEYVPNANVYGLGVSLDAARFCYFLRKLHNINVGYDDTLMGGEHGGVIVPFFSLWSIDLEISTIAESILDKAKNVGFEIVKYLGYSLHDCAHVFSKDIAWLLGEKDRAKYSAFSVYDDTCCIGLPVSNESNNVISKSILSQRENLQIESIKETFMKIINSIKEEIHFTDK